MRISDWSSDVCSSDLDEGWKAAAMGIEESAILQVFIDDHAAHACEQPAVSARANRQMLVSPCRLRAPGVNDDDPAAALYDRVQSFLEPGLADQRPLGDQRISARSEEHTSELPSLMR